MEDDRYASLRRIEGWDQAAIQQLTVMVAGVGALGNEVAKNLALLGVGKIVLVDFDHVTISDLTRSVLFRAGDAGLPKAEVAARVLAEINPDVQVLSLVSDVTHEVGLGVFRRMDAVLGCVDSVAARYHLNRHCWRVGVPWIEGGLAGYIGTVKVFCPPEGPCYECTLSTEDHRALGGKRNSCGDPPTQGTRRNAPTSPLIGSVTGAWMVQQMLRLLQYGDNAGCGWHINIATGESLALRFLKRATCYSHDERITVPIVKLPASAAGLLLRDFLDIAASELGPEARLNLRRNVVGSLTCPNCHEQEVVWLERDDLVEQRRRCPHCRTRRSPEYVNTLDRNAQRGGATLAELGIPPLDILMAANGSEHQFFELSGDTDTTLSWAG